MNREKILENIGMSLMKTGIPGIANLGGEILVRQSSNRMRKALESIAPDMERISKMVDDAAAAAGMSREDFIAAGEKSAREQEERESAELSERIQLAEQNVKAVFAEKGMDDGWEAYQTYRDARFGLSAYLYEAMGDTKAEEEKFALVKAETVAKFQVQGIDLTALDKIMDEAIGL